MLRIGVFGGSFSPVHNGHLHLAQFALSEFNLDKVYFVPARQNPLKTGQALLPSGLRVRCLRAAIRGKKSFELSSCELRRRGASYTIDTLRAFRKRFGSKTVLYFLAGADNARNLSRWKSADKVIKLSRFVILSRPGAARFKTPPGVLWASFPALDVSSSQVRRRWQAGQDLKGLVPAGVEQILKKSKKKADFPSKSKRKSR